MMTLLKARRWLTLGLTLLALNFSTVQPMAQTLSGGLPASSGGVSTSQLATATGLRQLQSEMLARRAGALVGKNNPRANPVYDSATAPTITATSTLPGTNPVANALPPASGTVASYRPYMSWTPGWAVNSGNGMVSVRDTTSSQPNTDYTSAANGTNNVVRFERFTDDPKPIIEIQGGTNAIRVIVDDQYLDMAGFVPGSGNIYLSVDFTKGGTLTPVQKIRKIAIETNQAVGRTIRSSKAYTVYADPAPGPRVVFLGDSWSTTANGSTLGLNNHARIAADWMGIPMSAANAIGGTGIATPLVSGAPNTTTSYGARIPDLAQMGGIDVLVVAHNTNDYSALVGGTLTNANYQTYVTIFLNNLRAALPNTPIVFVTGATTDETTTVTTTAEDNIAAIIAGMNAANDNRIAHVRTTKPANGGRAWLYGTGNTGAVAGDGNRDFFIGTVQAAHANDNGHAYWGQREAPAVINAVLGMK